MASPNRDENTKKGTDELFSLILPALPAVSDESFDSQGDVVPVTTPEGQIFVQIAVGTLTGYYGVGLHKVWATGGEMYSPTAFEVAGGKQNNRKWRLSMRLLMADGRKGKCLGQWLTDNNLEDTVPDSPNSPKRSRASDSASGAVSPKRPRAAASFQDDPQGSPPTGVRTTPMSESLESLSFIASLCGNMPHLSAEDLAAIPRLPRPPHSSPPRSMGRAASAAGSPRCAPRQATPAPQSAALERMPPFGSALAPAFGGDTPATLLAQMHASAAQQWFSPEWVANGMAHLWGPHSYDPSTMLKCPQGMEPPQPALAMRFVPACL